jgi:hypothetical protein
MQDDTPTIATATSVPAEPVASDYAPASPAPVARRRSGAGAVLFALVAFLLGGGLVGYFAWHGDLARYLPARPGNGTSSATSSGSSATGGDAANSAAPAAAQPLRAVVSLEARLAMLEDRFSRLDFKADAASGNAARAEGLLIASAARRMIERGEPLGYVADQLRLRFADAQPQAVETITTFARSPVTIDQLTARLEALAPDLTDTSQETNFLERTRTELASLFTVHSDSPTLLTPAARIDRARLMLTSRRIGSAIDEVERLPGAEAANKWIADARRFDDTQQALDLIETTAMLEPRRLRDGSGQDVDQPSPLSTPEPSPTPSTSPTAAPRG